MWLSKFHVSEIFRRGTNELGNETKKGHLSNLITKLFLSANLIDITQ